METLTPSTPAPQLSRRVRKLATDVRAEGNPIKDIAIGFIMISVALMIALQFWPQITASVETASNDGNTSSSDAALLDLIPTTLVVGLLAGGVAFLFNAFKKIRS